jgi:hypothetical protein
MHQFQLQYLVHVLGFQEVKDTVFRQGRDGGVGAETLDRC